MPEVVWLVLALALAAAWVLGPILRSGRPGPLEDDAAQAVAVRHRVVLETLRDLEADRRAGTLDEAAYLEAVAEAEARGVATAAVPESAAAPAVRDGRPAALAAAAAIAALLIAGSVVPASGVANATVVNEALAAQQSAEEARQGRIAAALRDLSDDPRDADTLSDLADAYLEDPTGEDLALAVEVLQAVITLEPERADAYERIVAAYLRAGDGPNARAALRSYAEVPTADAAELAFLDGLVALRLEDDRDAAVAAFDRFLDGAPDDPRAEMVRGLRAEAAED
jgi:cytochrome c-type biogenesis protein CcmH